MPKTLLVRIIIGTSIIYELHVMTRYILQKKEIRSVLFHVGHKFHWPMIIYASGILTGSRIFVGFALGSLHAHPLNIEYCQSDRT